MMRDRIRPEFEEMLRRALNDRVALAESRFFFGFDLAADADAAAVYTRDRAGNFTRAEPEERRDDWPSGTVRQEPRSASVFASKAYLAASKAYLAASEDVGVAIAAAQLRDALEERRRAGLGAVAQAADSELLALEVKLSRRIGMVTDIVA